jgi:hypothetical protein
MSLFRKKDAPAAAAKPASVPVPKFRGDERALAFEAELARGRWQEFHDFLDSLTDWDLRHFYVMELSRISGRPEWADQWVAARPDSSLPLLIRGAHGINWAWEARGSGRAKTVKEDAWPLFHQRLVEADKDLARAAALDDRDPTPHALSLTVARGLSLGQVELRRRFEQAHRRDPLNGGACVSMLQGTARKWGGSHEAMFGFARWAAGQAPDGHSAHKMIALAHIEMWLDSPKGEPQQTYFYAEPVKQEVRAAASRCVLSPNYSRNGGPLSWLDRNAFAFCFRLMRDYGAQLDQMRLIGPHVTSEPWNLQGKAGVIYEKHRQFAFREMYGAAAPPWATFAGQGQAAQ